MRRKRRRRRKFINKPRYTDEASYMKYKQWRDAVLQRDDYRCCQPSCCCNSKAKVEAHHIRTWAKSKRDRFNVDNGITLCRKAHRAITGKEELYEELYDIIIKMNKDPKTNVRQRTTE